MNSIKKLVQQNQDKHNSIHEQIAKLKESLSDTQIRAKSFSIRSPDRPDMRSSNVDVFNRLRYSTTSECDGVKLHELSDSLSSDLDVTADTTFFHQLKTNIKTESHPQRQKRMQIINNITVMGFNILYGSCRTSTQHFWENRRSAVVQIIQSYSPDIIGVQEAVYWQLDYIREHLHLYSQYGSSRNGFYNEKADEFCAVLYKKDKFRVVQGETFFLSETPELVSKSWGSVFNRIATAVKFEILASGKQFWFFSTQLDFSSDEAVRCNQTQVLLERMQKLNAEGLPVVLSGDFHSPSFGPAHQKLTQEGHLRDAASKAREVGKISGCSIHHFDQQASQDQEDFEKFEKRSHYDWIFSDPNTDVLSFEVCTDTYDGVQPSVHYPIIAEVKFQ
ncbi:endonuclease [Hexamita inflata]|uniref:Endonuclease n=1 Tax=Hexamita inflata TaxID=28002 RepID=A0AA86TZ42_9EUKA|nr:endonuclease [Hexamita inflata]CAI9935157.1 endonuclease [Hexamita inflata]